MTKESGVLSRDLVIKEITDTVRFLLRRKAEGAESVELEDLLDKGLEQNLVNDFEGQISIPEYETIVTRLFQSDQLMPKTSIAYNLPLQQIDEEIEKLVRTQRIRNIDDIRTRIFRKFRISPDDRELVNKNLLSRYIEIAQQVIFYVIHDLLTKGITDDTRILRAVKLERFDLEPQKITDLLTLGKKQFKAQTVDGTRQDANEQKQDDAARKRLEKMTLNKLAKMRERFLDKYVRPVRFQLIENNDINGVRHLGYRGILMGKNVEIKAFSQQNKVQEVKIIFNKLIRGQKKTFELDIEGLKFIREGPTGIGGFARKFQDVLDFWGYNSLQEILWFFMNGLTEKNGIHTSVVRFLRQNIIEYIKELDYTLNAYTLKKALEGK